jgi:hypothetical protein
VWSFFTRANASPPPPVRHPAETLLAHFDRLDRKQQDGTARQLAFLWSSFVEHYGGPRLFVERPATEQQAFIDGLVRLADHGSGHEDTDLGPYYFSVTMLRYFLDALRTNDTSPPAIALSKRLVGLTERGRKLQGETRSARPIQPERALIESLPF